MRLDVAQVATAVQLAEVIVGADLAGGGGGLQVFFGFAGVGRERLAFVVEAAEQQFGAGLLGLTALFDVGEQLVVVAQLRKSYTNCARLTQEAGLTGATCSSSSLAVFSSVWPRLRSASTRATLSTRVAGTMPRP